MPRVPQERSAAAGALWQRRAMRWEPLAATCRVGIQRIPALPRALPGCKPRPQLLLLPPDTLPFALPWLWEKRFFGVERPFVSEGDTRSSLRALRGARGVEQEHSQLWEGQGRKTAGG